MKRCIQTFAGLGLALGCLSQPALSQAQDDAPNAVPDLGPVLERLNQVIAGLDKVSGDLAKLEKTSSGNAKDKSIKTATKQLNDLNTAVGSLAKQLESQVMAAGKQAASAETAANLLQKLVTQQSAAASKLRQPAPRPKWEYKSIFGDSRIALEEEMNQIGKEGWEFFSITSFGRGSAAFARRPVM